MISRNKGILSYEFLVPLLAFLITAIGSEIYWHSVVIPRAEEIMVKNKLIAAQGGAGVKLGDRSIYLVIKDREPQWEIVFCIWGMIILAYKLGHITRERSLFKNDFVRLQPGERIIPEDALDRYKE